jgi:hypothetical protein
MSTSDVARVLRDRYISIIEKMSDDELMVKDFSPALNVALKSQAALDRRESNKAKTGGSEVAFAIIAMLRGDPPPRQIEDGLMIEGVAREVD